MPHSIPQKVDAFLDRIKDFEQGKVPKNTEALPPNIHAEMATEIHEHTSARWVEMLGEMLLSLAQKMNIDLSPSTKTVREQRVTEIERGSINAAKKCADIWKQKLPENIKSTLGIEHQFQYPASKSPNMRKKFLCSTHFIPWENIPPHIFAAFHDAQQRSRLLPNEQEFIFLLKEEHQANIDYLLALYRKETQQFDVPISQLTIPDFKFEQMLPIIQEALNTICPKKLQTPILAIDKIKFGKRSDQHIGIIDKAGRVKERIQNLEQEAHGIKAQLILFWNQHLSEPIFTPIREKLSK